MVNDTDGGGQDDVAKVTRGEEVGNPLLDIGNLDIEARRDDTALINPAVEFNDDLS